MGDFPIFGSLFRLLIGISLVVFLTYPLPAHGKSKAITLDRVTTKIARKEPNLLKFFRDEIAKQLPTIQLQSTHDPLILSVSLVELETSSSGRRATSSCVVSAILRKKEGGALVAVVRGKGKAEDSISAKSENEIAALRAAVSSTLKAIPKALP